MGKRPPRSTIGRWLVDDLVTALPLSRFDAQQAAILVIEAVRRDVLGAAGLLDHARCTGEELGVAAIAMRLDEAVRRLRGASMLREKAPQLGP